VHEKRNAITEGRGERKSGVLVLGGGGRRELPGGLLAVGKSSSEGGALIPMEKNKEEVPSKDLHGGYGGPVRPSGKERGPSKNKKKAVSRQTKEEWRKRGEESSLIAEKKKGVTAVLSL